jgi:hypothetical protein
VPESIKVAFHCFPDIKNPGSYTAPNGSWLPKAMVHPLAIGVPQFNFTEWWKVGEGATLREPFDVRDEIVPGLLRALEKVCNSLQEQASLLTMTAAGS